MQHSRIAGLLVALVGSGVYFNSFQRVFLFDDRFSILDNPNIRHLWPPWKFLLGTTRPVVDLTLAINYAIGELNVWGYHAFNLSIHILAALALFGIVRRSFQTAPLQDRFGSASFSLALVIVLIWTIHPLQTQSVTYIIQRAESLMGLFYLLTLYCVIRRAEFNEPFSDRTTGPGRWRKRIWSAAAVTSCAFGMGSKPVMVTAPLATLLYDRIFLSSSFKQVFAKRRGLYAALASTWILLGILLRDLPMSDATAGFAFKEVTPLQYALTQPGVLIHYLRLAFWPYPLVLDYDWPVARTAGSILPPSLIIGTLLCGALWKWRRNSPIGFLGICFFLILAPTSSFIPLADLAFEHRMYLPLAFVVVFSVLGTSCLLSRAITSDRLRHLLAIALLFGVVGGLGYTTIRRNMDYSSEESIWKDVVSKRPNNARAHESLGLTLAGQGKFEEAIPHYAQALLLKPNNPRTHNNLGLALAQQGKLSEAMTHYTLALQMDPNYAIALNNMGNALAKQGLLEKAIREYEKALRAQPNYAEAHNNLGLALAQQGKLEEAVDHFKESLRLEPRFADAHSNLGAVLAKQGHIDEAILHLSEALRLKPDNKTARSNLQTILNERGRLSQ